MHDREQLFGRGNKLPLKGVIVWMLRRIMSVGITLNQSFPDSIIYEQKFATPFQVYFHGIKYIRVLENGYRSFISNAGKLSYLKYRVCPDVMAYFLGCFRSFSISFD